jgi:hypothetical protein
MSGCFIKNCEGISNEGFCRNDDFDNGHKPRLFRTTNAPAGKQIQTKLVCSAYMGIPAKQPAFQIEVPFTLTEGVLAGEHASSSGNKEIFNGVIASSGDILLIGHGDTPDRSGHWVWEFHGKNNDNGTSVLKGGLHSTIGAVGSRTCTISF